MPSALGRKNNQFHNINNAKQRISNLYCRIDDAREHLLSVLLVCDEIL